MNLKFKLVSLFLVFSFVGFSQQNVNPQTYLPTISPVSPEAASLGKYGEVPVNLSTGRIGYNIPLYNISAGGTQFPLSLSYNYGGFMPEGTPSMTGLGWTAFFGGAVTRKMNGTTDERPTIGYLALANRLNDFPTATQSERDLLVHKAGDNTWDTEPDEFIISAGTISGSFYFGEDNVPIFKINKNYVVEILPYSTKFNGFIITDNNGLKYTFSAIEQSEYYLSEAGGEDVSEEYNSSWKLTEIAFPNSSDLITFEYTESVINSIVRTEFKKTKTGSGTLCSQGSSYTDIKEYYNSEQVLSRINFPNGYVILDIAAKRSNFSEYGNILNNISIFNTNDKLINKYKFNYYDEYEFYHVLTSIDKETAAGNQEYYVFDYYDLDKLPINQNFTTDIWGFYTDNSNYLLDFERGRYGALKKIVYPTKGHTELEYESNQVAMSAFSCDFSPNETKTATNIIEGGASEEITVTETLEIDKDQIIRVTLSGYITDAQQDVEAAFFKSTPPQANNPCPDASILYPLNNFYLGIVGEEEYQDFLEDPDNNGDDTLYKSDSKLFFVTPGTYILTTNTYSTSTNWAKAQITVNYNQNLDSDNVGGIRVSKTLDCANDGGPCIEKSYTYVSEDGSSSGLLLSNPKYLTSDVELKGFNSGVCNQQIFAYRSVVPLASYQGSHMLYKRVETQLISDGLSNGKIVSHFTGKKNYAPGQPYPVIDLKDWKKGLLEKEEVFKYAGGQYILQKEVIHTFDEVNFNNEPSLSKTTSLSATRNRYSYNDDDGGNLGGLNEYSDTRDYIYTESVQRTNLHLRTKSEEKLYENGTLIENVTNYYYDLPKGQLKETESSTSQSDELLVTKLTYPYDENTAISNTLMAKNMLSVRLKSEEYKRENGADQLLSILKTNHKVWENNLILPEFVQVSKGAGGLENRLRYHSYDIYGNPLEFSKANGVLVSYFWGYNHEYPVAKVENASINDIIGTGVSYQVINDIDSSEIEIKGELDKIRNGLPNAMVTTYTYDPLIGVTSMTDPRGYTIYYEYDNSNRLKEVKDANGNLVTDYEYQYKTQQ